MPATQAGTKISAGIDDYIDETKDQLNRFRKATDDLDYEGFLELMRKKPKDAANWRRSGGRRWLRSARTRWPP